MRSAALLSTIPAFATAVAYRHGRSTPAAKHASVTVGGDNSVIEYTVELGPFASCVIRLDKKKLNDVICGPRTASVPPPQPPAHVYIYTYLYFLRSHMIRGHIVTVANESPHDDPSCISYPMSIQILSTMSL